MKPFKSLYGTSKCNYDVGRVLIKNKVLLDRVFRETGLDREYFIVEKLCGRIAVAADRQYPKELMLCEKHLHAFLNRECRGRKNSDEYLGLIPTRRMKRIGDEFYIMWEDGTIESNKSPNPSVRKLCLAHADNDDFPDSDSDYDEWTKAQNKSIRAIQRLGGIR